MREEHSQMRDILARLTPAASQRQSGSDAELVEMLPMPLQQHNRKEEKILYPMCDRALAQCADELTGRLTEVLTLP